MYSIDLFWETDFMIFIPYARFLHAQKNDETTVRSLTSLPSLNDVIALPLLTKVANKKTSSITKSLLKKKKGKKQLVTTVTA